MAVEEHPRSKALDIWLLPCILGIIISSTFYLLLGKNIHRHVPGLWIGLAAGLLFMVLAGIIAAKGGKSGRYLRIISIPFLIFGIWGTLWMLLLLPMTKFSYHSPFEFLQAPLFLIIGILLRMIAKRRSGYCVTAQPFVDTTYKDENTRNDAEKEGERRADGRPSP